MLPSFAKLLYETVNGAEGSKKSQPETIYIHKAFCNALHTNVLSENVIDCFCYVLLLLHILQQHII